MATKIDLKRILSAVDKRDYDFHDNLTAEEKKSFSPFVMMRYISNVKNNDIDLQEWFIERTNERVNKNHWDLSKNHKGLLWKLCATVGTGDQFYHPYMKAPSKGKVNKIEKLLCDLYPAAKMDDIKVLAGLMTKADKEELFDKMGFDKKQRKEYE
jgi:hypothetical protein